MVFDYHECGVQETSGIVYVVGKGVFDKDSDALKEIRGRVHPLPPGYTQAEVDRQRALDQAPYQP